MCIWDDIKTDNKKIGFEEWTGLIWLTIGLVVGCCGNGIEPSGSTASDDFLPYMSDYPIPTERPQPVGEVSANFS
jgi:hypothetical protein